MTFVFAGALAVLFFVVAPVAAHLLRVRRAQERPFPPARLVPASPPATRQRRKLNDRALFSIRALAVLALALLGATPLIQCSRLAIGRTGGASVAMAIVVDDSMSMRARDDGKSTRFDHAKRDASDLIAGAREGDAVAVVLAGDPVRLVLAPTTDLGAAEAAIEALRPSDRATDLDGAVALASSLLSGMPQPQRRVVLLSDRCDGQPDRTPIGEGAAVPVWIPLRPLSEDAHDCAVLQAEERDGHVVARVACTGPTEERKRSLVIRSKSEELGRVSLFGRMGGHDGAVDLEVETNGRSSEAAVAVLEEGRDLIVEDDRAPVAHHLEAMTVGVLSDRTMSKVATGGPPPVEQALAALQTGALIQPVPTVPDTVEDLARFTALVLDDPDGLTPEARDAVGRWLEQGGVALVGLGPRAARAPLGATLDPFVPGVPRWVDQAPAGAKAEDAASFGPSGAGLVRLEPKGRTLFEIDRLANARTLVRWSDDAPLLIERRMGRGMAYLVGLPFNPAWSDLPLRPAFLALLSQVADTARVRGGSKRIDVGRAWVLDDAAIEVRTESGEFPVRRVDGKVRIVPTEAGRYDIRSGDEVDTRFAVIPEREVDLRPRPAAESTSDQALGATTARVDVSRWIALVLLALLAAELALRLVASRREARLGEIMK